MEPDVKKLEEKLDRHLEIYANNGKESKRVADNLELLIKKNVEQDDKIRDIQTWANEHGRLEKLFQADLKEHFDADNIIQGQILSQMKRTEPYLMGVETTERVGLFLGKVFYFVGKTVIFAASVYAAWLLLKNYTK